MLMKETNIEKRNTPVNQRPTDVDSRLLALLTMLGSKKLFIIVHYQSELTS